MHVKCSTTTVPNSIKIDNLVFGSEPVSYGPTSSTGFYNGIDPPISGYTIYYATSGMTVPSIVVANNDTELIYWSKAYGGDTTNLLYDNGVINWSIGNLGSVVATTPIIANSKYRITCTTGPQFRFYMLLSKLTNGSTYTLSYKYNIISGTTFSMNDWNDTAISNINNIDYGTYKFSSATGSRATYDSTYRFMDFNINTGAIVDIWDVQLEQKSSYTSFTNGTRAINSIEDGLSYMKNSDKTAAFNINHPGIVTSGLSLNLDAGLVSSYPRTGNTWYDLSGNNNGTLVNGFSYDTTNYGSLIFDGISDYVTITSSYSHLSSSSIETVIYVSSFQPSGITSIGGYDVNNASTFSLSVAGMIYLDNSTHKINASVITQTQTYRVVTSSTIITTGKYYHIIFTKDTINGLMQLYINSISESTNTFDAATYSKWPASGGVDVGSDTIQISYTQSSNTNWNYRYFNGKIPIFRLYNRILSSTEVSQNYNAVKGRFGL